VPRLRRDWGPLGRDPDSVGVLLSCMVLLWVLRLTHMVNGWVFSGLVVVVVLAVRGYAAYAAGRQVVASEPEIPVEWWGVRRPWRAEDQKVLDDGIAAG
jgi:branched-chain amino acid transport system permease protein